MAADAETLFAEYHEPVFRYLCRAAGQREAAWDLTQNVFLRMSRSAVPAATGSGTTAPGADVELTLRPGQSIPVDIVPLSPGVKMPYEQCGVRATMLRVGVNYWPMPIEDRRLVTTDLWLVERLLDGTERGQTLSLRGSFNRATPFYFDTVTDRGAALEFFGEFTLTTIGDHLTMRLEVKSRLIENGRASTAISEGNLWRSRRVNPVLTLAPGEVVAVELPRLSESDSGAFAGHTFSIRVRSRQIR